MLANALTYSHTILKQCVNKNEKVIDATVGNGHDTIFLAELIGKKGMVYGFDIQSEAIQIAKEKLTSLHLQEQCQLFCTGHENIAQIIPEKIEIAAAIFNLGYFPGGNKQITTQSDTTLTAIQNILPMLKHKGRIVLVVYTGHPGGKAEGNAIHDFVTQLPQKDYTVLQYQFINQIHEPPHLLVIEKK